MLYICGDFIASSPAKTVSAMFVTQVMSIVVFTDVLNYAPAVSPPEAPVTTPKVSGVRTVIVGSSRANVLLFIRHLEKKERENGYIQNEIHIDTFYPHACTYNGI